MCLNVAMASKCGISVSIYQLVHSKMQLELSRAHTQRTASASYLRAAVAALIIIQVCVRWRPLPMYARPVVRMSRMHMACSRHSTFCDACGLCQRNQSILEPVFRQFHCAYVSLRCLDLKKWWFSCWRRQMPTDKTDCFAPCACTQGKKSILSLHGWAYHPRWGSLP